MSCQCGAQPLIAEATAVMGISLEKYMLPCQTKAFLGFDCPGCGIQRSIEFLINGHLWEAFKMYPAIYPLLFLGLTVGLNAIKAKAIYQKLIMVFGMASVVFILSNFIYKLFL